MINFVQLKLTLRTVLVYVYIYINIIVYINTIVLCNKKPFRCPILCFIALAFSYFRGQVKKE